MSRWTYFRWRVRLLALIDYLLGTHLVDKTVDHWWREIEAMQTEITSLQTRMEELDDARRSTLRDMCLNYLQLRQAHSPDSWLHFDPRDPAEESAIDLLTKALVAPHWARWGISHIAGEDAGSFSYDLTPDWQALHQDALKRVANFPASLLNWLAEQSSASAPDKNHPRHSEKRDLH
jgi:hypothetical protein